MQGPAVGILNQRQNTSVAPITHVWIKSWETPAGPLWRPDLVGEARLWLGKFNRPLTSMPESGHVEPRSEVQHEQATDFRGHRYTCFLRRILIAHDGLVGTNALDFF